MQAAWATGATSTPSARFAVCATVALKNVRTAGSGSLSTSSGAKTWEWSRLWPCGTVCTGQVNLNQVTGFLFLFEDTLWAGPVSLARLWTHLSQRRSTRCVGPDASRLVCAHRLSNLQINFVIGDPATSEAGNTNESRCSFGCQVDTF